MTDEKRTENPAAAMAALEFGDLSSCIVDYLQNTHPGPPDRAQIIEFYRRARAFTRSLEAAFPFLKDTP